MLTERKIMLAFTGASTHVRRRPLTRRHLSGRDVRLDYLAGFPWHQDREVHVADVAITFKKRVVAEASQPGVTVAQIAHRYDLDALRISNWKNKFGSGAALVPVEVTTDDRRA
jgi:hypothetical protein